MLVLDMSLFRRRKTPEIIDLGERYRMQKKREENIRMQANSSQQTKSSSNSDAGGLGFFGAIANTVSSPKNNSFQTYKSSDDTEEKRRKLSKRLLDITNKLEELSNQIYHLQQRIEVLERKGGVGGF